MRIRVHLFAALFGCCLAGAAIAQAPVQTRVRGTIDAIDATTVTVTTRDGKKTALAIAPDLGITSIVAAKITDIKAGSYIGTAAITESDGTLRALEIQVFPESMRGVGEGHRPWDLGPQSTMTNGTVGDVVVAQGRKLTLRYKDGEKTVIVPDTAPIITYEPGTRAMLVPGAHVIVTATEKPDGSLVAGRIGVGKDGLTPPM